MGVAVITDSAAALPADLVERYDITVVPMWLTLSGRLTRDDQVSVDEVIAHDEVSTSGPSPGEFVAAIESRASEDGVLVLTVAATMSSTFAAAQQGAASVETPVAVLDTSTAAGAQALVVLHAARVAERGGNLGEVQDAATRTIDAVRLVAMVPDLDRLARSGRVPAAAGWAGRRLHLRPLFEFRDGKARPMRPALSVDAAKDRILAMVKRSRATRRSTARHRPPRQRPRRGTGPVAPSRDRGDAGDVVRRTVQHRDDRPHGSRTRGAGLVVGVACRRVSRPDPCLPVSRSSFVTADAIELFPRHWQAGAEPRAAVVVAHGFTASADDVGVVALAEALHARGFDVTTYDARGHGRSGGLCTLGDLERHDVAAAVALARQRCSKVVLVGASMGGIAVLRYAASDPSIAGVVTVSCPARWTLPRNARAVLAALLTRTPPGRMVAARYLGVAVAPRWRSPDPPVALAARVRSPFAVVHGRSDPFIPVSAACELHDAARDPRRLDIVPGLGHTLEPSAVTPTVDAVEWTLLPAALAC